MPRALRGEQPLGAEAGEEKGGVGEPHAVDCSSPVPEADARNLCRKRRDAGGVKVAATPQTQNGRVPGGSVRTSASVVPLGTRRRGGRDGSRGLLVLALGHSHTASPPRGRTRQMPEVRAGGRRRRRSPRPRRNDGDRVQVRQAWGPAPPEHTRTGGRFPQGRLGATSDLMACAGSRHK